MNDNEWQKIVGLIEKVHDGEAAKEELIGILSQIKLSGELSTSILNPIELIKEIDLVVIIWAQASKTQSKIGGVMCHTHDIVAIRSRGKKRVTFKGIFLSTQKPINPEKIRGYKYTIEDEVVDTETGKSVYQILSTMKSREEGIGQLAQLSDILAASNSDTPPAVS